MKIAFSTVACPEWTLTRVAERAGAWGYEGVELRSFGSGSARIACDPELTAPAKTRAMFARAGVEIMNVATSVRFDDPVTPPVIGHLFDKDLAVREAQGAIDLAVTLECPNVRVFAFEIVGSESRKSAVARIASRLGRAADHCRNHGVRLLLENGGSFPRSGDIAEILDAVGSPLVGAAYCPAVARAAGEAPGDGVNVLGERLVVAKVKDYKGGRPCVLGEGDLECRGTVEALARAGFDGWLVHEHDRLWFPAAAEAEAVMPKSAAALYEWAGARAAALTR